MRTLTVIEFLSLDGVMQGLGSPDEDRDGGFEHGGWGAPYAEGIQRSVAEGGGLTATTAYLLGRRTYEKMAQFWPSQPDANPMAAHLNSTPKYVATSTGNALDWVHSEVLDGPVDTAVPRLKETGEGTVAVLGSGLLVKSLMAHDLVDELQLFVHPLLLGTGKRLFGDLPSPRSLELVSHSATHQGSLVLRYARQT